MPDHKSGDYKLAAVNYYLVGDQTQVGTCEIFKCSPRSLMRWVEQYQKNGELVRQSRVPVAYKVKQEHVSFILNELEKNKSITIAMLLDKLKKYIPDANIIMVNRVSDNIQRPTWRMNGDLNGI